MSWAIHVEGLSKKYKLGRGHTQKFDSLYQASSDVVIAAVNRLTLGKFSELLPKRIEARPPEIQSEHLVLSPAQFVDAPEGEFWALRDLSFQIEAGQRVGIIGKNGSGKSTLLKILSRITSPSAGKFSYRGRLVSLLEVGTGFHPDLTGRENIFLNAKINGMSTREILRAFDEIVDFSELGAQIDTPIKRYSSGMYMRLAFSVAAHLESEILIVDEVLAVGDTGFQKKCMDKMLAIGNSGRTLLFVSHDMDAVRKVCSVALELAHGRIISHGSVVKSDEHPTGLGVNEGAGLSSVTAAISDYSFGAMRRGEMVWNDLDQSQLPSGKLAIRKLALLTDGGEGSERFRSSEPFQVIMECVQYMPLGKCEFLLNVLLASGRELLTTRCEFDFAGNDGVQVHKITCSIPSGLFNVGAYRLSLAIIDPESDGDSRVLRDGVGFEIVGAEASKPANTFFAESPINLRLAWSKDGLRPWLQA